MGRSIRYEERTAYCAGVGYVVSMPPRRYFQTVLEASGEPLVPGGAGGAGGAVGAWWRAASLGLGV